MHTIALCPFCDRAAHAKMCAAQRAVFDPVSPDTEIIRLMRVERDLRAQLATASAHIQALLPNIDDDLAHYVAIDAARTWLRRKPR